MKKQFTIDRLIIENGCVKIPAGDYADLAAAVTQLVNLIRAGCKIDELWLQRSEPFKEERQEQKEPLCL